MRGRSWRAIHVYLSDPRKAEAFLTAIAFPALREMADRGAIGAWFFIRYWEGGSHVRLRLADCTHDGFTGLLGTIGAVIGDYLNPHAPTEAEYYASATALPGEPDPAQTVWRPEGAVLELPYVPEIQRYGGPSAIEVSEALFAVSSGLAAKLIEATPQNYGARLIQAADMMFAAALKLFPTPNSMLNFLGGYAAFWPDIPAGGPPDEETRSAATRIVARQLGQREADGRRTPSRLWADAIADAAGRLRSLAQSGELVSPRDGTIVRDPQTADQVIAAIFFSQAHMFNNRLGIAPAVERQIALRLREAVCEADWPAPGISA